MNPSNLCYLPIVNLYDFLFQLPLPGLKVVDLALVVFWESVLVTEHIATLAFDP